MLAPNVTLGADKCTAKVVFGLRGHRIRGLYQPADAAKIEDASGNPMPTSKRDAFLVVKLN